MKRAAVRSILFVVVLLTLGVTAEAQQPKKVPRIGYLLTGNAAGAPRVSRECDWLCASVAT